MCGVSPKIRARLIEGVVKLQIQVMSLKVCNQKNRWHCAGELSKSIKDVLSLKSYTLSKFLTVYLSGRSDLA